MFLKTGINDVNIKAAIMKRILFVLPSLQNGGTVTTLKNTLPYIDREKCQIDIFPITNSGPNYDYISRYATILGTRLEGDNRVDFKRKIKSIVFLVVKGVKKILCSMGYDPSAVIFKSVVARLQRNRYDEVIAFQEVQATRLVSFFKDVHKVAWVHCDYSKIEQSEINIDIKQNVYDSYDKIVCVSEFTKQQFIRIIPNTESRTVAIHNLISSESIIKRSTDIIDDAQFAKSKGLRFVSLGRLHPVKRFSAIPKIALRLKERGLVFEWFIIGGDDSDKGLIEESIEKYNVSNLVKLLGNKNNPYPYIKNADVLICTSFSEACPNVLNEAKILGTPIVSTNFGSVGEMMTEGVEGLVSPIEQIDWAIFRLFKEDGLYTCIKKNVTNYNYDNKDILKKLSDATSLEFVS